MVVHFPVASWSLVTLLDLFGNYFVKQSGWLTGFLLSVGVITGLIAMIAGLKDYIAIEDNSPALNTAIYHMTGAFITFTFYTISLLLRWDGTTFQSADFPVLVFSLLGFLCLCVTGWLGGKLVYTYGTGTKKTFDSS